MERWLCALQAEEIVQVSLTDGGGVVERARTGVVGDEPKQVEMPVGRDELVQSTAKMAYFVGASWNGRHIDAGARWAARKRRRNGAHDAHQGTVLVLGLPLRVEVVASWDAKALSVERDEAEG